MEALPVKKFCVEVSASSYPKKEAVVESQGIYKVPGKTHAVVS